MTIVRHNYPPYRITLRWVFTLTLHIMINLTKQNPEVHEVIDTIQAYMQELPQIHCPVVHIFTKGIYTRQIFMPAFTFDEQRKEWVQTVIISKIHKHQHVFNISMGAAEVFNAQDESMGIMEAPFINITEPGTRRILRIIRDCVWTTSHSVDFITGEENDYTDEEKEFLVNRIEDIIIEKRNVSLKTSKQEEIQCHMSQQQLE